MIFSRDLLFIHIPKTAGTSIRVYLFEVLPRPVYYTLPKPREGERILPGITRIEAGQHQTMAQAQELVRQYGYELSQFPLILAVLRNPYDLEVSRYKFFQQQYARRPERPDPQHAMSLDFEAFCRLPAQVPLESYLQIDGRFPPNLCLIRFENLQNELDEALVRIGIPKRKALPRVNTSFHSDYRSYYTPETEAAVYQKYHWAFEAGYYQRMQVGEVPPTAPLKQEIADLKQELLALRIKHHELQAQHKQLAEAYGEQSRWAAGLQTELQNKDQAIQGYERTLARFRPLLSAAGRLSGWLRRPDS